MTTIKGHTLTNPEDWTPEEALSLLRQIRIEGATNPHLLAVAAAGESLAAFILRHTTEGSPDSTIPALLAASSACGGLALLHSLDGVEVAEILSAAAYALDSGQVHR